MPNYPLYSILELQKLTPEELGEIAGYYSVEVTFKQQTIYEILEAQDKQIKLESI